MRRKKHIMNTMQMAIALWVMAALMACSGSLERMKQQAEQALQAAEQADFTAVPADTVKVQQAAKHIEAFAATYKDDPSVPDLLYRLALVVQRQKKSVEAVELLRRVYSLYPSSPSAHKALFLEGFILANELSDTAGARKAYQHFLDQYGQWDEQLTQNARFELEHLGKSPEQLLQELLDKQKPDSLQMPS
ncbi:MAG: tetratricopeptide repeat protein [Chitinophagales bacterium]|nr:tetratricopeptide repeat protein [Chitinophagales bacterium]MDW8392956.1 tetratricopeptide repeat protein [Chitinophagales bacterium]